MQEKGKMTLLQEPVQDPEVTLEPEPTSDEGEETEEGDDQTELADLMVSPTTDEEQEPENYDLELTQNDDGEVVYRLKARVKKNFLGFIPWESTQQAELNDATGEVSLEEPQGFLSQLLTALSTTE